MSRLEKITITNDARVPRAAAFQNGVTWYIYIRDADSGLYVQREFGGARGAEVLIAKPVKRVEVIQDPDGGKAYLYFINDECLLRIEVTDALETPTVQAYTRSATWYDAVPGGQGSGADIQASSPKLDPPAIALVATADPAYRRLIIAAPNVALTRNKFLTGFRIFREESIAGQGFQLFSTVLYLGSTPFSILVPTTVTPLTRWYATSYKTRYGFLESDPSNIEADNGDLRSDVVAGNTGTGADLAWTVTTKTPIKKSAGPDFTDANAGSGADLAWTLTTKTPIKKSYGPDFTDANAGSGVDVSWAVNGTEIINP